MRPGSEIYYDWGAEYGCGEPDCGPSCERCDRFLEFWNLVFMEFELAADGTLTPLPKQNIDTGLGLERCAMLVQDVTSIFDTDGFQPIMDWIAEESGVAYGDSPAATKAHRVLADHGRGDDLPRRDGVTPSNEGRGYVLRRHHPPRGPSGAPHRPARRLSRCRRRGRADGAWYPELVENAAEIERVVRPRRSGSARRSSAG